MTKILATIPDPTGAVEILIEQEPVEKVSYLSKFAIDGDGSGASHNDPCFKPDTTLHNNGKALNSDVDFFAAIPPQIRKRTKGIVMGCRGTATNTVNGLKASFVVGDIGPHHKIGEGSIALARALGIPASPISGGTEDHIIYWEIYPGQQADGYILQPA